ncbi:hypothetical protein IJT93_06935 [bacterium]|nr:hypothetical protein [bacterium]
MDWRVQISNHYNMIHDEYKDLAVRTGWLNHIGTIEDIEDKSIQVTCWPNLMRRCRRDPDKKTDINVALIDASWTFGTGVADENTFIYKLNERYPNVTFDNYGIGGFGPAQSLELLKHHVLKQKKYNLIVYDLYMETLFSNQEVKIMHGDCKINREYLLIGTISRDIFSEKGYKYKTSLDKSWPTENRLLLTDVLKRLYCVKANAANNSLQYYIINESSQKQYGLVSLVFDDMQKTCNDNGADFMICCLDNSSFPYLSNCIKTDCPKLNLDFAGSNRTEFKVLNNPVFHPNYKVHDYWFRQFSKWFDNSKYMKSKSPNPPSFDS